MSYLHLNVRHFMHFYIGLHFAEYLDNWSSCGRHWTFNLIVGDTWSSTWIIDFTLQSTWTLGVLCGLWEALELLDLLREDTCKACGEWFFIFMGCFGKRQLDLFTWKMVYSSHSHFDLFTWKMILLHVHTWIYSRGTWFFFTRTLLMLILIRVSHFGIARRAILLLDQDIL